MINLMLNGHAIELTEDNHGEHESAIRDAVGTADYASAADKIWQQVGEWAESWSRYPDEYTTFNSYQEIVESIAAHLGLAADSTVDSATEIMAQHILDLKECWVNISHDPTEAGHHSQSLDAVTLALYNKLTELQSYAHVGTINMVLPDVFTISNKFLRNGYTCHHNAAKQIAPVFAAYTFDDLFGGVQLTATAHYQVHRWRELTFSSRI
jgi:hypothetical protein